MAQVSISTACQLSAGHFQRYWVSLWRGGISVGAGAPGSAPPLLQWQDGAPLAGMRHIGLAAWDKFLA